MAPRRLDVPLYYQPTMGDDPQAWINNVMARRRRLQSRPIGFRTLPYNLRKLLSGTVMVTDAHNTSAEVSNEKDTWFPDPLKIAQSIISKPTIREMGEDEEKIYCGMMYGPEYSDYQHKSKKRIAKSIRRLFVNILPKMNDLMEQRKREHKEQIIKDFEAWRRRGKKEILKAKEEELRQVEIDLPNRIHLERERALLALKGNMEKEIKEVNKTRKQYLKEAYEYQLNWVLKEREQHYIDRMNLYSTVWNKILQNLSQRAKRKISELNCSVNQSINEDAVREMTDKQDFENQLTVRNFHDKVERALNRIKAKVLTEELHIQQEKKKGERIKMIVNLWDSLLEHIIMLFDKVAVSGFKGKPGECNYFLNRDIIEKFKKLYKEDKMKESDTSKSGDKHKVDEIKKSEEISPVLSRELSVFTIDMTVGNPDKDLIVKLNLFQVKKLIEETTCAILTKPLQVAEFMKDRSVELKSFSEESQGSSYILNKLSDACSIIDKILLSSKKKKKFPEAAKEGPFTIETDPELTKRINHLIKCYRSTPDNMRVLTNV